MMSLNPCCTVIDRALANPHGITFEAKKNSQTRGMQVKPRLVEIFETQMWQQGDAEKLRNLGFGATSTSTEICLYFPEA